MTILDLVAEKMTVCRELFCQLGHALVAVAVVERFKKEAMYGLSAGTKKSGLWWTFHCKLNRKTCACLCRAFFGANY